MNETPTMALTTDFAEARDRMVDGQVRPNKVIDPRIVRAMRTLPRERFLPTALASLAYADEDVPLPNGRALMEPMVIARLVQLLRVRDGETALVVAAGPGYGAALLAACGAQVTALEDDENLMALARAALPAAAPGVTLVQGPVTEGWPGSAPYDVILLEGAVLQLPDILATQLKPGGRVAAVLAQPGGAQPGARSGVAAGVLAEAVMAGHTPASAPRPTSTAQLPCSRSSRHARRSPSDAVVAHCGTGCGPHHRAGVCHAS